MAGTRNLTMDSRKKIKALSIQGTIDGWYIPEWGTRGCLNAKILNSFNVIKSERKYHIFRKKKFDLVSQAKHKRSKFKYPCYMVVKRLDQVLQRIVGKKSGFRGCLPSKKFLKKYYVHICPNDEMNLFECWKDYQKLSESAKRM
jgi:hypothetical protein